MRKDGDDTLFIDYKATRQRVNFVAGNVKAMAARLGLDLRPFNTSFRIGCTSDMAKEGVPEEIMRIVCDGSPLSWLGSIFVSRPLLCRVELSWGASPRLS